jgi:hypothetical protein
MPVSNRLAGNSEKRAMVPVEQATKKFTLEPKVPFLSDLLIYFLVHCPIILQ